MAGADPSGTGNVLNAAMSIYFLDAKLGSASIAQWCAGSRPETADGVFKISQKAGRAIDLLFQKLRARDEPLFRAVRRQRIEIDWQFGAGEGIRTPDPNLGKGRRKR